MAHSKAKTSFGIEQILNEPKSYSNLVASNPTQFNELLPRTSNNGIAQHESAFDPYLFNSHSSSYFSPHVPPPSLFPPVYHVDQYPSVFQKGQHTMNSAYFFLCIRRVHF